MKINGAYEKQRSLWEQAGYLLPAFDRQKMLDSVKQAPRWLHFGPGNIFRAFIAALQQSLLDQGLSETGIIVAAPNGREIIDSVYRPHDNVGLLVTMQADQSMEKKMISSIAESLGSEVGSEDWLRLQEILRAPSLQLISFTITEKGYKLYAADGVFQTDVQEDLKNGPAKPVSFMARVTALLYERYLHGATPLTLLSMDNCSHNGLVLKKSLQTIAEKWQANGLVEAGFAAYIEEKIAFPCSMIDKITPRPSETVQGVLEKDGIENIGFITSSRGGCYAPFVNAEKTQYLVVEDHFVNGRPPLEKAGVIFTDRKTVDRVERMKVCTCLNPLHTALAVYGCLLGYTTIASEMKNPLLLRFVEKIGLEEGMKVVTDPGVLNPADFIRECLEERFPNPAIPDTPQRIACDTSQKVGIRFGETIKAYDKDPALQAEDLVYIPLAIAGWLRYLTGTDDQGKEFPVSPDPLLEELQKQIGGLALGSSFAAHQLLAPILENEKIFGINLYAAGLGEKIEGFFTALMKEPGAVENTLKKYLQA